MASIIKKPTSPAPSPAPKPIPKPANESSRKVAVENHRESANIITRNAAPPPAPPAPKR